MHENERNRWDAFAPWELASLQDFFRNFAPMRRYDDNLQRIAQEIEESMERRGIQPLSADQGPRGAQS